MGSELVIVMRDFCEHALISLCNDYHNYFIFTKGEKTKIIKYIDYYDLDRTIEELIYRIFLKGKIKVYIYLDNDKLYLSETEYRDKQAILQRTFKWNSSIIPERKRKKIIKKINNLDFLKLNQDYTDKTYLRNSMYISDVIKNEVLKNTKDFLYLSINEEKYTDIYYVFSLIRMRKKQLLMIEHAIDFFNNCVKDALKLDDDDKIIFDGLTMNILNSLEKQLLSGEKSLNEITTILFERNKESSCK